MIGVALAQEGRSSEGSHVRAPTQELQAIHRPMCRTDIRRVQLLFVATIGHLCLLIGVVNDAEQTRLAPGLFPSSE
jgi:hypothetical protein